MQVIINFIKGFGNAITSIFDFIIGFFQDLVYLILLTAKFLLLVPSFFSWLPSLVTSMLITLFGIVIIYKILGREG